MIRKKLKDYALRLIFPDWPAVPFDNTYPWLGYAFQQLMKDGGATKPMYTWGTIQAAGLAKVLKIPRISVIEFGVAGGAGLIALEHVAERVEQLTDVAIDVYGFDTGTGLPKPRDFRDQPNMWFEGQLPMNRSRLETSLSRASLRIGLVSDTVPELLSQKPAPIGFVSFDLDLYSSTTDALSLYNAAYDYLLPRVVSYFDDILGHTYNDFSGERLAIAEFNDVNEWRKLSPVRGLRYFVPVRHRHHAFWDGMYLAHFFQHPLYGELDSLRKAVYTDEHGIDLRLPADSGWRSRVPSGVLDRYPSETADRSGEVC